MKSAHPTNDTPPAEGHGPAPGAGLSGKKLLGVMVLLVTLNDNNLMRRIAKFHGDGEVEAARAAPDAGDFHGVSTSTIGLNDSV